MSQYDGKKRVFIFQIKDDKGNLVTDFVFDRVKKGTTKTTIDEFMGAFTSTVYIPSKAENDGRYAIRFSDNYHWRINALNKSFSYEQLEAIYDRHKTCTDWKSCFKLHSVIPLSDFLNSPSANPNDKQKVYDGRFGTAKYKGSGYTGSENTGNSNTGNTGNTGTGTGSGNTGNTGNSNTISTTTTTKSSGSSWLLILLLGGVTFGYYKKKKAKNLQKK